MTKWGILVPAALVTLFFMASCQQPNLSGYALKTSPAGKCLDCHSADASGAQGGLTGAPLANQVTYALAGHSQGLRKVSPSGGYSAPSPAIEASAGCTKCHASQGFINWVTFGPVPVALSGTTSADAMINASITMSTADATSILNSCFLCHDPHSQYTMGLRTIDLDVTAATSGRAVPMASANASSGTTSTMWSAKSYVSGSGNLCVNCHQDRRTLTTRNAYFLPVTVSTTSISLSSKLVKLNAAGSQALVPGGTPHHGPQGDFLMGLDSASVTTIPGYTGISNGYTPTYTWSSASPTPFTLSPHYTNTSTNIAGYNSCVTCHVELGDHSMYLTNLSSTPNDKLSVCVACHAVGATAATVNLPLGSNKTMVASPTSFSNAIANSTLLSDIQEAKRVLLNYFLDATKFYSATRLLNDGTTNYSTYTSTPDGTINTTSTKAGYSTTGLMGYVGTDLTGPTISSPLGSSVAVPVPDDNDGKTYWLLADAIAASNTLIKDGTIKIAASVAASGSGADYGVVASPTQDALGNQVALAAPFSAGASIVWNKDWSTSTANLYLTAAQAQAYYNFMLFNEDRSEGVHNPKYAAQLLYDAIHLIPALSQPTNWSSRP